MAKDVQARLRDPVGYAFAALPGAKAAWAEVPEAERGALLWSAQSAAGIPASEMSLWTAIGRLLTPDLPAVSAPQEFIEPQAKDAKASDSLDVFSLHLGARSAVDVLARGGITSKEAEGIVLDVLLSRGAEAEAFDIGAFAHNYAVLLPLGSYDEAVRQKAASALATDFRSIQSADGQMTRAELSLLSASPAYATLSGRGVAWVDGDKAIIGDAVVTADGEQLIIETADGVLFAWRAGSGPSARYVVDDVLTPEDLIAPQSRTSQAGNSDAGTAVVAAGSPGEDPDEEPPRDTVVYRALDPKTGEVKYVGITRQYPVRSSFWLRDRGYNITQVERAGTLTRAEARGVEQVLIETHDLRTLDNLINSIWRFNPRYTALVARGREILLQARYPGIQ